MSAVTNDQDIVQASIQAKMLANEAVTTDLKKKEESSDSFKPEQVAGIVQLCSNQIATITDQL